MSTRPTAWQCTNPLHVFPYACTALAEPKHDTQNRCINHRPGHELGCTGRLGMLPVAVDIGVPTTKTLSNEHPGHRTTILTPICYAWLHTSYPLMTPVHGLGWARSSFLVHMAEAGSTVAPWRNQGRCSRSAHTCPALGKQTLHIDGHMAASEQGHSTVRPW
jgi:hypothetical protein